MDKLIASLESKFPDLAFTAGRQFSWSPETGEIFYRTGPENQKSLWSLLHETGHALLQHQSYQNDFELLQMELAAWQRAKQLGQEYGIVIDEDHIQDCLETYREWLYKRSICPNCGTKCLQQDGSARYGCHNCGTSWQVSNDRFARTYRRRASLAQIEKSPL
ncbi:MAG TPA: hypothetical protein VHA05_00345 [Candidatus Saccharimonadales bacterium]|nr:hypothetical protein [Candidatus Saccharimonadales bacterium]